MANRMTAVSTGLLLILAAIPACPLGHQAEAQAAARAGAAGGGRPPRGGQRGPDRTRPGNADRDMRDRQADGPAARWQPGARPGARRQLDADTLQRLTDQALSRLLADGWAALRAGEPEAAAAAFLDALQLKGDCAEAALGLAMANACASNWKPAQTMLERLAGDTSLPPTVVRMATYNLAALHARQNQVGRAILVLHRRLETSAAPDEMILNAQASLLAKLGESERKSLAIFPAAQKAVEQQREKLAAARPDHVPWGIAWVSRTDAQRLKAAGAAEIRARELVFVLPDGSAMPLKGQKPPVNELRPEWAAAQVARALAAAGAVAAVAAGEPSGPAPQPAQPAPAANVAPPAPAQPAEPPPAGAAPAPAAAPVSVTLRGAAFAVAPDRALTWAGLVAGATRVTLTGADGTARPATVVVVDERVGLALLKVEGGGMSPMAIAASARAQDVCAAAFVRPTVFQPAPELLPGQLVHSAGRWTARLEAHPRTAGGPVVDFDGNVLGMLVAQRSDAIDRLAVIPAEIIRKFCAAHLTVAEQTVGDVQDCVLELEAVRAAGQ